jgi:hypothetical protein
MFLSNDGIRVFANVPRVRFFSLLGTSIGHKTPIFTANIPKFHIRNRGWVLITDEFNEFC